jgi:hypothetical protein
LEWVHIIHGIISEEVVLAMRIIRNPHKSLATVRISPLNPQTSNTDWSETLIMDGSITYGWAIIGTCIVEDTNTTIINLKLSFCWRNHHFYAQVALTRVQQGF